MSDRHQFKSTIVNENVSTWSKIEMCYVSRRQEKAWCSGLGFLGPWWSLIIESWWQQGVQGQASCKVQWSSATNYTNYHLSWDVGRQMLCEACGQKSYATSYLRRSATQLWATWQTDPARLLLTVVWLPGKMMFFLSSDDRASSSSPKCNTIITSSASIPSMGSARAPSSSGMSRKSSLVSTFGRGPSTLSQTWQGRTLQTQYSSDPLR